ncbi:hypothetical protein TNCV_4068841 [Trichonephila clavipes]|nr:hypothetical protein TNCV_4068841 [Trichonephila clavipes]
MIAGREANFTRVLDSIESCLHLVAEKEKLKRDTAQLNPRRSPSRILTAVIAASEEDIKSATLGAELGITS